MTAIEMTASQGKTPALMQMIAIFMLQALILTLTIAMTSAADWVGCHDSIRVEQRNVHARRCSIRAPHPEPNVHGLQGGGMPGEAALDTSNVPLP